MPFDSYDPKTPRTLSQSSVTFFNPFRNLYGGSEQECLQLGRSITELFDVPASYRAITSSYDRRLRLHGIRYDTPFDWGWNRSYVFNGVYWRPKSHLRFRRPKKLTVIVNTCETGYLERFHDLYRQMDQELNLVYVSNLLRELTGLQGEVFHSPIRVESFGKPLAAIAQDRQKPFIVGRVSRDEIAKYHLPNTIRLVRYLHKVNGVFAALGGSCLAHPLAKEHSVYKLYSEGVLAVPSFLNTVDVFWYQTGTWLEAFGRVVFEAMASRKPVVVQRYGGYSEFITHGVDGFVYDSMDECLEIIEMLRQNPDERARIGANARATIERMYCPAVLREQFKVFL